MQPNRIAVYLTAAAGLIGAVAVPVDNLDISSTAGVAAGLFTIFGVVNKWLTGWQNHEAMSFHEGTYAQDDGEIGDPHDSLPHHPVTDPANIPVDEIDYKR